MTIIRLLLDRSNLRLASPKYVRAWHATRTYAQCPHHSIAVVCLDRSSHLTLVGCIQLAYTFITLCLRLCCTLIHLCQLQSELHLDLVARIVIHDTFPGREEASYQPTARQCQWGPRLEGERCNRTETNNAGRSAPFLELEIWKTRHAPFSIRPLFDNCGVGGELAVTSNPHQMAALAPLPLWTVVLEMPVVGADLPTNASPSWMSPGWLSQR